MFNFTKGQGGEIEIEFTAEIINDASKFSKQEIEIQEGIWAANGSYSSSDVNNVRDGSTSTYWESRVTTNYVEVDMIVNYFFRGFKVYCGSSYRPSTYKIMASLDGTTYAEIATGNMTAATGWQTFVLENPVRTRFIRINFGYSSRLYIYELALLIGDFGFDISGEEYSYIGGELIDKEYKVLDIEKHPTKDNTLLLTMSPFSRFSTVEGDITVSYDDSISNLTGKGGAVESFVETFTPTDLVPEPNPGIEEAINIAPEVDVDFISIEYIFGFENENITIAPEVTVVFEEVEIVNP